MGAFTPSTGRICDAHGLGAGPDGRCVICRREAGGGERSSGGGAVATALLLLAVGVGGAFAYRSLRRPATRDAAVVVAAPQAAASPSAEADDEGQPDPVQRIAERRAAAEVRQRTIEAAMY